MNIMNTGINITNTKVEIDRPLKPCKDSRFYDSDPEQTKKNNQRYSFETGSKTFEDMIEWRTRSGDKPLILKNNEVLVVVDNSTFNDERIVSIYTKNPLKVYREGVIPDVKTDKITIDMLEKEIDKLEKRLEEKDKIINQAQELLYNYQRSEV